MLEWSLDAIGAADCVTQVIAAVPEGLQDRVPASAGTKPVTAVVGGSSRSESVSNALVAAEGEVVLIHDAARPLAEADLFVRLVAALDEDEGLAGAIVAGPIADTVKRVEGDVVADTLNRSELRAAETPQAFRRAPLAEALASGDLATATDEAMLVEAAGGKVAVIESKQENFKVTTPADLERAAAILSSR